MVEDDGTRRDGEAVTDPAVDRASSVPTTADLAAWRAVLADLDRDVSDAERIAQLRALEELKSAACAAQARITVDLEVSQRGEQAAAEVPVGKRGKGIGAQIALARRESPSRGGRLLGFAKAMVREMPHTYAALRHGAISEWRATLLVRESACLSVADRTAYDLEVAGDRARMEQLGDRQLVAYAKRVAYRLDGASVVARARKAEGERCVTLRPAPDTMSYLTGLLPVAQGVSVYAALGKAADALRAQGDPRSRGQVMADLLVERVTGQTTAEAVPLEVQLVMTDRTLLAGDGEPALIPGYGTVPGEWARTLVADRTRLATFGDRGADATGDDAGAREPDEATLVYLRRLFTSPTSGQLIAMESRGRTAPAGLAQFIDTRDQICRTPWCDAPIRHRDHIRSYADGGPTAADDLQGLCEACNYAKEAPGWRARARPAGDGPHEVEITTPTGQQYRSAAPILPGHPGLWPSGPLQAHGPPTARSTGRVIRLRWPRAHPPQSTAV